MTRGVVFRPTTGPSRCCIPSPHPGERPEAAYLVFITDCLSFECFGGLWCLGHPVCVDCGIGVREGRLIYTRREETPVVQAVTSR